MSEGFDIEKFGDDTITIHKVREILLLLVGIIVIGFFATNIPKLMEVAQTYWWLGLTGIVGILSSFIISKIPALNFNVPLSEPPIFPIPKKWLFVLSGLGFLLTFFLLSQTSYSIEAPSFQILELGTFGEAVLDIFAALAEDIVFFAVVPGITFTVIYYISKSPTTALIAVLFVTPSVFLTYHTLHYGWADVVSSFAVLIFGLEQTIIMIVLREILFVHGRHLGNNLGKLFFSQMTITTFFLTILTSIWFWGFVGVIVVLLVIRWRKK